MHSRKTAGRTKASPNSAVPVPEIPLTEGEELLDSHASIWDTD